MGKVVKCDDGHSYTSTKPVCLHGMDRQNFFLLTHKLVPLMQPKNAAVTVPRAIPNSYECSESQHAWNTWQLDTHQYKLPFSNSNISHNW
jgi:hypothetical protein